MFWFVSVYTHTCTHTMYIYIFSSYSCTYAHTHTYIHIQHNAQVQDKTEIEKAVAAGATILQVRFASAAVQSFMAFAGVQLKADMPRQCISIATVSGKQGGSEVQYANQLLAAKYDCVMFSRLVDDANKIELKRYLQFILRAMYSKKSNTIKINENKVLLLCTLHVFICACAVCVACHVQQGGQHNEDQRKQGIVVVYATCIYSCMCSLCCVPCSITMKINENKVLVCTRNVFICANSCCNSSLWFVSDIRTHIHTHTHVHFCFVS